MDLKQESVELYEDGPNIVEINDEIIEYEVPKFEHCLDYLLQNIDHDSVLENIQVCPTIIVKKELENKNISEVKYNSNVKQEISSKIESELLTTHCDLPTLKDESTEFPDLCGRKHDDRKSNAFNNIGKSKRRCPCPVCQKYFISSKSRSKHIDGHFRKRFAVCKFCGKCMKRNEFLRHYFIHLVKNRTRKVSQRIIEDHLINNTVEKLYKCAVCSKEFNQKSGLSRHLKIHSNDKPFKCNMCSKKFKWKSILQGHLLIHTNKKSFRCDICSKEFNQKSYLRKHLKTHVNEKAFKCVICFKGFVDKINLEQHLIIHFDKKFKCEICSKEFTQKGNLRTHIITHTNQKLFKCNICCKEFTQKCNLKKHLKIHTDENQFKCDICFKGFNQKSSLQQHSIIHSGKKTFKCDICSKELNSNSSLQRHLIIHSDKKPFNCNICSKEFTRKSNLQRHLIVHRN